MIEEKTILKLYFEDELSYRDIAKKLSCSETPVKEAMRRYGLKPRSKSESSILRCKKKPETNPGRKGMPKNPNYGKDNHAWKGGYVRKDGYKLISVDGEQRLEHRYIWEQYHKKPIPPGYQIHHIDGDKLNNKIENLQMISNSDHQKLHYQPTDKKGRFIKR